jgi:multifunctional methyltransferase subunit TRM112
MKILTLNFLTCAVKSCKASNDSFPLHPKEAELVKDDLQLNRLLLVNVLPRIDWKALRTTSTEVVARQETPCTVLFVKISAY